MKVCLTGMSLALLAMVVNAAPPLGDTQGTVAAVRVLPAAGAVKSFEVWFSQTQNDRWNCLSQGRIVVYENGYGVTSESFKQMFSLAMLAQTSGKPLAFDSAGTNPCSNVNTAWVIG